MLLQHSIPVGRCKKSALLFLYFLIAFSPKGDPCKPAQRLILQPYSDAPSHAYSRTSQSKFRLTSIQLPIPCNLVEPFREIHCVVRKHRMEGWKEPYQREPRKKLGRCEQRSLWGIVSRPSLCRLSRCIWSAKHRFPTGAGDRSERLRWFEEKIWK